MDTTHFLIAILASLFAWIIFWAYRQTKYFEKKQIPYEKPYLFFGNSLQLALLKKTSGDLLQNLSETKFRNEPIFGFFEFIKPVLIVKDIDFVYRVLIKDFQHFVDHGFEIDPDRNPYDSNLFNMSGNQWRAFRQKFSPMFTSGKLKTMANQMEVLSSSMIQLLEKRNLSKDVDLKEFMNQLAMDIIGSCGYGIDAHNLGNEEESEFQIVGKRVFRITAWRFLKLLLMQIFPKLAKNLNVKFTDKRVAEYFGGIIEDALQHRAASGYQRNDFIQLMLTLKEKGSIEITTRDSSDDYLNLETTENESTEKFDLDHAKIIGNALSFLTMGFEATALTTLYLCYDLAGNQDIQDFVREEVRRVVDEKGGRFNYDTFKNMPYLEMCLKESQRLHSLIPVLFRVCTKEYTFPGTNITVRPGDSLKIPVQAIHMNPDVYPEPTKFDPERFRDGGTNILPGAFLPFGDGPRMCIAMRFALLEVKIIVAHLLYHYKLAPSRKTKPLRFNPMHFMLYPVNTLYFDLERIEKK